MEQWKTCIYNGETYDNYEVSNGGKIRSLGNDKSRKTKILKPTEHVNGYLYVGLYKNKKRKQIFVHDLVAIAFIPNPQNKTQVNHINEDKTDNRVENLEWTTPKENINHGTRTERQQKTMTEKYGKRVKCVETGEIFVSSYDAGRKTGISRQHIGDCCRGKRKTCGGFHWEFVEE